MEHTQKWIARHENDKHWIEDADHIPIANIFDSGEEGKAKAEFIVRACNAHDGLVEACKLVYENLKPAYPSDHLCMKKLQQALAKAEGKEV